jgi:hypothetical protein
MVVDFNPYPAAADRSPYLRHASFTYQRGALYLNLLLRSGQDSARRVTERTTWGPNDFDDLDVVGSVRFEKIGGEQKTLLRTRTENVTALRSGKMGGQFVFGDRLHSSHLDDESVRHRNFRIPLSVAVGVGADYAKASVPLVFGSEHRGLDESERLTNRRL